MGFLTSNLMYFLLFSSLSATAFPGKTATMILLIKPVYLALNIILPDTRDKTTNMVNRVSILTELTLKEAVWLSHFVSVSFGASLVAQMVKNLPVMLETRV